jgi:hypothetical protein
MKKTIDVVRVIVWSIVLVVILIVLNAKRIVEWRNHVNRQKCIENLRKIDAGNEQPATDSEEK